MDLLLEIIVEIILEGAMEASSSKKVPLPARIFLAVVLFGLYAFISGVLVVVGLQNDSPLIVVIGILLFVFFTVGILFKVWKIKKR